MRNRYRKDRPSAKEEERVKGKRRKGIKAWEDKKKTASRSFQKSGRVCEESHVTVFAFVSWQESNG